MKNKKLLSLGLAVSMVFTMTGCGSDSGGDSSSNKNTEVPTIDKINVGEDYKDLSAKITILTDRTDIVDSVYKRYAEQFMKIYPKIKVTYEGITDYAESVTLRLTNGDWGDICFIPDSVEKSEFSNYFIPLGDHSVLDNIYNYVTEKTYDGKVYGIPNGGTAGGIAYNKRIWKEAGITELPKTPDEFIKDLQLINDKTDAIPLYTNFSAGWTMGAWNDYVGIASSGDPDYKNNKLLHQKNPFTKNEENSGPYAVFYTLYEAVKQKLVEEDPASSDWESSKARINNGEIATMVFGSWCVNQFKVAGKHPDDIGYMPFPISIGGKQAAAAGGQYAFAVNNKASADNQIAAMLYIKWLIEESTIYDDEGSIPALKGKDLPDSLSEFDGVELLSDNAPAEGEESLYDDIRNTAEVLSGDYPVTEVLEAALYGKKSLDDLMKE
ncbi:MAG: ABC transporter substrate-binding protein [Lachnospiraceae bacterium]|nr:ABC transporter substrate-binding protein [Lachnospiraceae bacterium]